MVRREPKFEFEFSCRVIICARDLCRRAVADCLAGGWVSVCHARVLCRNGKETENSLISAILSGHYFVVCYGFFVAIVVLEVICT